MSGLGVKPGKAQCEHLIFRFAGFRALLKAKRKEAGLTETVFAQWLRKPPSYVAKYEIGDRRLDVIEYLDIAAAIGFDPPTVIQALTKK